MKNDCPKNVAAFFDSLTGDYTEKIVRCFPRYPEMLWTVLNYLPPQLNVTRILDLGAGTGNLSMLAHQMFPDAALTVVDISQDSIDTCRSRFHDSPNVEFLVDDFRSLDFANDRFDLIVSSIAIHHLTSDEKKTLFRRISAWLTEGGVLSLADQCAGETTDLTKRHTDLWKQISFEAGSTEEEWQMWMRHQSDCDCHDTLTDQMQWLRDAGVVAVDCTWRYLLWSVIQARKTNGD